MSSHPSACEHLEAEWPKTPGDARDIYNPLAAICKGCGKSIRDLLRESQPSEGHPGNPERPARLMRLRAETSNVAIGGMTGIAIHCGDKQIGFVTCKVETVEEIAFRINSFEPGAAPEREEG